MTEPAPRAGHAFLLVTMTAALLAAAAAGVLLWRVEALTAAANAREATLAEILGEVTRLRIEQSTGKQGPAALLEKLRTYAPILVSGRTTQPDYDAAHKEMQAVLRAFAAIGKDAYPAILARIGELRGDKNFDELKWLLEAAVRSDAEAGKDLARKVLLGLLLPAPRLRWHAADLLLRTDRPLAQATLRQILVTESSRGIDPERAGAYGVTIPDPAATATTGFHNFVVHYARSDDPQLADTLLMVIGRAGHDRMTIQECVEELGRRGCERAIEPIKKLYENPPGAQQDPLFLGKCLDALAAIQGEAARPFLEQALAQATTERLANQLKGMLAKPLVKAEGGK